MKTKKITLLIGFLIILSGSCKDYLDPLMRDDRQIGDLWKFAEMSNGLVTQCYNYITTNYNNNEGAYLDCVTDNAVMTSNTSTVRKMAVGTIMPSEDWFATYWTQSYIAINNLNIFLKDRRGYNVRYLTVDKLNDFLRTRLQGEAFALRAWFQWELLKRFGGKGTDGKLLGFPIILEPVDITKEVNYSRNTYDECVQQIIKDCDSAYKYLPIAHRDWLVTDPAISSYAGGRNWGRMDGITTRAIKAMVYLTWASPLFNPANDKSRWNLAAVNAREVMNFKLTVDGSRTDGFKPAAGVNWFDPNFPGIILPSRYLANNTDMERAFYPGGFQGNGVMGPTQELVNAFPMNNGYPINDPANRGNYSAANPYNNRDPRFYSMIFYNNALAKRGNTGATMYTFETFKGGKDEAYAKSTNTNTNYYIKKFVWMSLNFNDATLNRMPHAKFHIRWAHVVLAFAEAANQDVGPLDAGKYGISAKTAIGYLRSRATYDNAPGFTTDPYLDEVAAAGAASFDAFLKNERRIETCFEGLRFYDIRRWATPLSELNKPVHGAQITKNTDGTFTYNLNQEVEPRSFGSHYLPIPYQEMFRMSKLVQNEGWEAWQ